MYRCSESHRCCAARSPPSSALCCGSLLSIELVRSAGCQEWYTCALSSMSMALHVLALWNWAMHCWAVSISTFFNAIATGIWSSTSRPLCWSSSIPLNRLPSSWPHLCWRSEIIHCCAAASPHSFALFGENFLPTNIVECSGCRELLCYY